MENLGRLTYGRELKLGMDDGTYRKVTVIRARANGMLVHELGCGQYAMGYGHIRTLFEGREEAIYPGCVVAKMGKAQEDYVKMCLGIGGEPKGVLESIRGFFPMFRKSTYRAAQEKAAI